MVAFNKNRKPVFFNPEWIEPYSCCECDAEITITHLHSDKEKCEGYDFPNEEIINYVAKQVEEMHKSAVKWVKEQSTGRKR